MSSARTNARSGGQDPEGRSAPDGVGPRVGNARPTRSRTTSPRRTSPPKSTKNGTAASSIRVTIRSDFAAGRDVQQQILDAVDRNGFTAHSTFAIKLALEEALINAIKHGNKLNPAKSVHIEATINAKEAEIIIEDEGPGFDRRSVPDPTAEENLEKCSGRGLLLIEAYMNSVEWSRQGRRLHMIKRNGEEPGGGR